MRRSNTVFVILTAAIAALFVANLLWGTVSIPPKDVVGILLGDEGERASWRFIVMQSRLPQAITAMLCGGALSVSGLMLQTAFRNPLADPFVFGVNSGAGLGVALVMLAFSGTITAGAYSMTGFVAVFVAAFAGAMAVMSVIFMLSSMVRNGVMLLIVGLMIGYLASSAISILNFLATEEGVKSYLVWGLGNFGGVSMPQMPFFATVTVGGLVLALLDKTAQRPAARRTLCRKPWREHTPAAQPAARNHGLAHSCGHGLLRPGVVHRTGCASHHTHDGAHRQPPHAPSGNHSLRFGHCAAVQRTLHPARRKRHNTPQRRDTPHRSTRNHLCYHQGTAQGISQSGAFPLILHSSLK